MNFANNYSINNTIGKFYRSSYNSEFLKVCCVQHCNENNNIKIYYIQKLYQKWIYKSQIFIINNAGKCVLGLDAVLTSLNQKEISLCYDHYIDFEKGQYHFLDYSKIYKILNKNSKNLQIFLPKNSDLKAIFNGKEYTIVRLEMPC